MFYVTKVSISFKNNALLLITFAQKAGYGG